MGEGWRVSKRERERIVCRFTFNMQRVRVINILLNVLRNSHKSQRVMGGRSNERNG